jgi:tripartite ATP-independent transporter DctM subunit
MAAALMVTVHIIAVRRGYKPVREKMSAPGEILHQLKDSIWALLLPFGIILGIRFGVFTPTEAGAIAVVFCTLVGVFFYKQLKWHHFPIIMRNTVYSTSAVILIIVAASIFGQYLSWERIPYVLTRSLSDFAAEPWMMLVVINIFLLFMGMFLEGGAVLIIVAPLLVPVVTGLGVHPVHFGLIIIVNIMIGGITPPFGSMMFTTCSITGVSIGSFVREVYPFIIALILVLLVVTYVPSLMMFLPNLL